MLPTTMKSSRRIKFGPNFTDPQSQTLNFTTPGSRRRTQLKGILKKNDKDTESEPPVTTASENLIVGQVKILKRGQVLNEINESSRILKEVNNKQMKEITECFAGSVFSDSPPPSSVPLPGFLRRNLLKS